MTRIFISHSYSDEVIAYKLVNFLLAALSIKEEEIFCSSNPDQGLEYRFTGVPDQLKEKLKNSSALIVLITADSLHSAWIPFEAGTFWTTDKPVIPILGPGLTHDDLPGPLRSLLSIPIDAKDWSDKVNNAINQLVKQLKIEQKVTKRRNDTLQEFSNALRAWQSQRLAPDLAPQQEIEQLKAQIQELKRSHSKLLSESFNEAAKQLKDEQRHFHLVGISALGKIADTEEYYYEQAMKKLTAYVRENAPYKKQVAQEDNLHASEAVSEETLRKRLRKNIQAVLTILSESRRKRAEQGKKSFRPDLRQTDLSYIKIGSGNNLSEAIFVRTNLRNANLRSVNLTRADLKEANLIEANLIDADLKGANLIDADLTGANFTRADLTGAILTGADLTRADLTGANLSQAHNLKLEQIESASCKEGTRLPILDFSQVSYVC